ncbi:membrane protein [Streptomyces sp. AS58]|uniref:Uncharacterized protein n=1 Tax=Streptomyces cadmiisoli TaxID=2184053 RepID=A0A2Z4J7B7_9ACTN|nr:MULTISPECIES: hypothetical protein [Streptomyces]AWW40283.1 hypothetical protein DN051_29430 [Streptomyces cadmiisoli]KOV65144.1 membrane protein [Streptomyces sp. AS58]
MPDNQDPANWGPEPVRPRWLLTLRFVATVVCFPVLCVVGLATFLVFIVLALLTELIAMFSSGYERGFGDVMESALDRVVRLGSWFVGWRQLRHEGDTAHYRARVDKIVAHWTALASAPPEPDKPEPPVECEIPLSFYRGVGGRYVVETATAQGWELLPSDVRKKVRLRWAAAAEAH